MKETYSEKIAWTLDQKIFHFFEVLDVYYHKFNGQVYLNFSGGKDSTVLKFLCDKWCSIYGYEKIKCLFNNTTNEHKEILDFVKSFGDEVIWTRPKMTFAETLKKYGYPVISKQTARFISRYRKTKSSEMKSFYKDGIKKDGSKSAFKIAKRWHFILEAPFQTTDRCCDILKKDPIHKFEKETGLKPINGVLASESNQRKMRYLKNDGCINWEEGKEICSPLSLFTEDNIWECIDKFNIEICPIYYDQIIDGELVKAEKRTGCAWCLFGLYCESKDDNRITRLSKREPNRYKSMMDKMGYRDVLSFLGYKDLP